MKKDRSNASDTPDDSTGAAVNKSKNVYVDINDLRRLQHQAKGFSFLTKQPVNSALSGKNVSKLRGRGLNFEELRHYRPGDDIRSMDWKVTRRTGKPHIKVYTEERERNVYLVVNQSSSMFFGSTNKMKSVIAAEISALMAWKVTDSGDRIGAIIFNDTKVKVVPAKRGKQHVVNVLTEVVKMNHQLKVGKGRESNANSINEALIKLSHICGHNALIIIVGDGHGWDTKSTQLIKNIRQHNDVIACQIYDPLEQQLPEMSNMVVSDGEKQIQFSSLNRNTQDKYRASIEQQENRFESATRKNRIPLLFLNTLEPIEKQLRKELGKVG
ncbi:DUF58 domain-containing protein [Thalassotalea psychrophila]|uniref:DUF58 domain-containing protein n=1 Tax=Thalassotalea psychrophila TaxID=3065647 RepID=A0ABY9TZ96_9GAMM|nr:DUF58 domain-containing protein [Colwelliaceae bacterium SQ149]